MENSNFWGISFSFKAFNEIHKKSFLMSYSVNYDLLADLVTSWLHVSLG